MLFKNASIMMNWNGFICANHLVGDVKTALEATKSLVEMHEKKVAENQKKGQEEPKGLFTDLELNSVNQYRVFAFLELEDYQKVIDYTKENEKYFQYT